jgi:hypothetical protein
MEEIRIDSTIMLSIFLIHITCVGWIPVKRLKFRPIGMLTTITNYIVIEYPL